MSFPVMILGESGAGKTTSLRDLPPEKTLLIQALSKPLPFQSQGWSKFNGQSGSVYQSDNPSIVQQAIQGAPQHGKEIIVLDDFQYVMSNEFMRRSSEKSYDKFTEIGRNAWEILMMAASQEAPTRIYFLWHTETTSDLKLKAKTIGKMLDEKITIEGMFSIVLRSFIDLEHRSHHFATSSNGFDPVKTPIGMFSEPVIDNSLAVVDQAITQFYGV